MAEWCVSGSDYEDERQPGETSDTVVSLDLGGLKIPAARLLDLMKRAEEGRSMELGCLSESHRKRGKKKAKRHRHSKLHSPAGLKSGEEVSETASEVRSTTSTTATDYREGRRANVLNFDPHYDPELDDQPPITMETKPTRGPRAPPKPQQTKLASLDMIIQANTRRNQQVLDAPSATPTEPIDTPLARPTIHSPPYDPATHVPSDITDVNGKGAGLENGEPMEVPSFGFDDDSDMEGQNSEVDMKFSVLSQLNRVENLLNSEGLT